MMPDQEMGPERLTPKSLPGARRGYDRRAVDQLLDEARRGWAALQEEHRRLLAEIDRAGGLEFLARDLGEVGRDVGRLLGDAQATSHGLRERAQADSTQRLAAAQAEAQRLLVEAEEQAFQVRSGAWVQGMDVLRQAVETGRAVVADAQAEVLIIRAAAEQEAHRLVASARREAQELVRAARFAAERAVLEARAQAEQPVVIEPPEEPEETARESGRRWRRGREPVPPTVPEVIKVIQPSAGPVGAARPGIDPGSYGDALAAEVEALWESGEVVMTPAEPEGPPAAVPVPVPVAPAASPPVLEGRAEVLSAVDEVVAEAPEPAGVESEAAEPEVTEPEAAERRVVVVEEPSPPGPETAAPAEWGAVPAEVDEAREGVAEVEPEGAEPEGPEPAPVPPARAEPADGGLSELFARLRGGEPAPPKRRRGKTAPGIEPTLPGLGLVAVVEVDPLELRERLVLPIQNSALRRVKDNLLELQNAALAALRVAGAWEGGGAAAEAIAPALDPVAEEAAEAGARAAGAFTGGDAPAPVISARSGDLATAMARELASQVAGALEESAGAGPLEQSAAVSRVFRAWRAEEAERWVRAVAYAAYHDSLLAGLAVAGVRAVRPVPQGLLCAECPAFRNVPWDPAGEPPAGTARPPAHPECVCTVAPG